MHGILRPPFQELTLASRSRFLKSPLNISINNHVLFRQVTLNNKRRRDKTASEFADSLMSYLGQKSERSSASYETFQQSLRKRAE